MIEFENKRYRILNKLGEIVKIMRGTEFLKDFSTKTYAETMLRRHLGKKWEKEWANYRIEVIDE